MGGVLGAPRVALDGGALSRPPTFERERESSYQYYLPRRRPYTLAQLRAYIASAWGVTPTGSRPFSPLPVRGIRLSRCFQPQPRSPIQALSALPLWLLPSGHWSRRTPLGGAERLTRSDTVSVRYPPSRQSGKPSARCPPKEGGIWLLGSPHPWRYSHFWVGVCDWLLKVHRRGLGGLAWGTLRAPRLYPSIKRVFEMSTQSF